MKVVRQITQAERNRFAHILRISPEDMAKRAVVVAKLPKPVSVKLDHWPLWALALRVLRKDGEHGLGDTIERVIGPETSKRFQELYEWAFGQSCGCKNRKAKFNTIYRYTSD